MSFTWLHFTALSAPSIDEIKKFLHKKNLKQLKTNPYQTFLSALFDEFQNKFMRFLLLMRRVMRDGTYQFECRQPVKLDVRELFLWCQMWFFYGILAVFDTKIQKISKCNENFLTIIAEKNRIIKFPHNLHISLTSCFSPLIISRKNGLRKLSTLHKTLFSSHFASANSSRLLLITWQFFLSA